VDVGHNKPTISRPIASITFGTTALSELPVRLRIGDDDFVFTPGVEAHQTGAFTRRQAARRRIFTLRNQDFGSVFVIAGAEAFGRFLSGPRFQAEAVPFRAMLFRVLLQIAQRCALSVYFGLGEGSRMLPNAGLEAGGEGK